MLGAIPAQILAIAQQLSRKERPQRVSVKRLLNWFQAKRRGAKVISDINDALRAAGLATKPELNQAGYDDYLTFLLIRESEPTASPAVPENDRKQVKPLPEIPEVAESEPPDQPSDDFLEPEVDDEHQQTDDDRPVVSRPAD